MKSKLLEYMNQSRDKTNQFKMALREVEDHIVYARNFDSEASTLIP